MKLIFAIGFFLAWTSLIAALSGGLGGFINVPSAAFLIPIVLCLALASTGKQALMDCYQLCFKEQTIEDPKRIQQARLFLQVAAKQSLLIGALGVLIGWCAMGAGIEDWSNFGPTFGISLLTLVYGVMMKAIFDIADNRIEGRFCNQGIS
ncbi:hypothetical protein [uncultured Pseudoteredinibacter sp.]|uniref:hypothetical protein n=1 Tax=uncultured Pseudoteredinibacter sp. TaxID=1641701 RepID=UPI00262E5C18|nr:hypothetical protein [uncultured Pseudoteredinibacter sp.]